MDTELFIPPTAFHMGIPVPDSLLANVSHTVYFFSISWDLFICMSFVPQPVAAIKAKL